MKKYIYGFFDIGNSAFQVLIISTIFAPYFANQIVGDAQLGSAYWQWTVGLCAIFVAIAGIILGNFSDRLKNGRKNFFYISTFACIIFTLFLWNSKPNSQYLVYTLVIFFIANFFFEISQMFYNSFLFDFSEKKNRGRVSGLAMSFGYLGLIPLLIFLIYNFLIPDVTLFNLDKSNFEHIRIVAVITVLWFFLFSIPICIKINSLKISQVKKKQVQSSFKLIFKNKKLTDLGKFLIARLFYADAIIAVQVSFAVFIKTYLGFSFADMLKILLLAAFAQGVGSYIGGIINDKIGSKKLIQISLICVFLTICGILIFKSKLSFICIFTFGAIFFGILQSASRVLMTSFLNKDNLGQGFGLFTLASRSTAILGPIMIGTITYLLSLEIGFLSINILLLTGYLLLKNVDVPRSY